MPRVFIQKGPDMHSKRSRLTAKLETGPKVTSVEQAPGSIKTVDENIAQTSNVCTQR